MRPPRALASQTRDIVPGLNGFHPPLGTLRNVSCDGGEIKDSILAQSINETVDELITTPPPVIALRARPQRGLARNKTLDFARLKHDDINPEPRIEGVKPRFEKRNHVGLIPCRTTCAHIKRSPRAIGSVD